MELTGGPGSPRSPFGPASQPLFSEKMIRNNEETQFAFFLQVKIIFVKKFLKVNRKFHSLYYVI